MKLPALQQFAASIRAMPAGKRKYRINDLCNLFLDEFDGLHFTKTSGYPYIKHA